MYIMSNGKEYVMRDPMNQGRYLHTTSSVQASQFTYKQARQILQSKKAALRWVKNYKIIDLETKQEEDLKLSNECVYTEESSHDFDLSAIDSIGNEVKLLMEFSCYDCMELNKMKASLNQALSYYDSAISDVHHARMNHKPPAHVRTKIDGMLNTLQEKRRDIKQTMAKIDILVESQKDGWSNSKTKAALEKVSGSPYKGRTEYYDKAMRLLEGSNEKS